MPRKTYKPSQVEKAKELLAEGAGRRALMSEAGISDADARAVTRITGQTLAEFQADIGERVKRIMTKVAERMERDVEQLPPTALAVTFGILHDKLHGGSAAPAVQHQTNIQINGNVGRDDVIGLITGAKAATKQPVSYPEAQPMEVVAAEEPLPQATRIGENSPPAPVPTPDPTPTEGNPSSIP